MARLNKAAFDAGEQLVNGTLSAFQDSLAAVIEGAKTAKAAFHDFAQATIHVLAQVIARLITVRILSAVFGVSESDLQKSGAGAILRARGGVDPGGVDRVVPLRRMAMGGVVRGPHMAVIGEGSAPAEAFVPLPDGRRIPVDMRSLRGSGGQEVNVYIQAWDGQDVVRVLSKNRGLLRAFAAQDLQERNAVRQGLTQVRR